MVTQQLLKLATAVAIMASCKHKWCHKDWRTEGLHQRPYHSGCVCLLNRPFLGLFLKKENFPSRTVHFLPYHLLYIWEGMQVWIEMWYMSKNTLSASCGASDFSCCVPVCSRGPRSCQIFNLQKCQSLPKLLDIEGPWSALVSFPQVLQWLIPFYSCVAQSLSPVEIIDRIFEELNVKQNTHE